MNLWFCDGKPRTQRHTKAHRALWRTAHNVDGKAIARRHRNAAKAGLMGVLCFLQVGRRRLKMSKMKQLERADVCNFGFPPQANLRANQRYSQPRTSPVAVTDGSSSIAASCFRVGQRYVCKTSLYAKARAAIAKHGRSLKSEQ